MMEKFHTGLVVAVLLLVGALLGSGLLEWGDRRQATPSDPGVAVGSTSSTRGEELERISVEVLNGGGARGAAARVSERLRDMGFDVKTFGNAPAPQDETVLIDRSGRAWASRALSDSLGGIPVRSDAAPELYVDATLILGSDWRKLLE
jgi:hypothetical protein